MSETKRDGDSTARDVSLGKPAQQPNGKFAKGNHGGPGRPPGLGYAAKLRHLMGEDIEKIVAVMRAKALDGDPVAARILMDRVLPALKPADEPVVLSIPPTGTLAEQAHAVIQAAADGEIAHSQAAQIVTALGGVAKIIETTDLLKRIEALEAAATRGGTKP